MRFPQILRPFRLLRQDLYNLRFRYVSDWTVFNQLIIASAVYVFFTNLLPGITFASDLYVLTGKSWGTIEVVFSTGLCGVIFSLYVLPWTNSSASLHIRDYIALICYLKASWRACAHIRPFRFSIQPLTILGVTGPFSVLAENIYTLCITSFHVGKFPQSPSIELSIAFPRYLFFPLWRGPSYTLVGCTISLPSSMRMTGPCDM